MDKEFVGGLAAIIGGLLLFLAVLVGGIQGISLMVEPTVVVLVDGKEIFQGSNACVSEMSLGSATSIQIGRGPLCIIPGPKFTSKNVKVIPK